MNNTMSARLRDVVCVNVFVNGPGGGNPVPLVRDALGLQPAEMQAIAGRYGLEAAFVLPAEVPDADWRIRYFVPRHEMEMCGHATVGALWALRQSGAWTSRSARVQTLSGVVDAWWDEAQQRAWVSQPLVQVRRLSPAQQQGVATVLDPIGVHGLQALHGPMVNASTSRPKTLVQLDSKETLDALVPRWEAVESCCSALESTGLYPYALGSLEGPVPELLARQFPRASGYPEDVATGIAASAL